ncbi:Pnap_2097 family protein [Zoogloea dura]|jgi:probable biosynthetic protein (TIGR04099 family)|uniref:Uncharacterized protein n=1 Tax=Zoogloea dura TaxID=2728840 RepID=A0A848G989_9RHOO|nr:Pnap_2097 family protein [Zoogloea dura]NML26121.1 hypothetical protein [Zoogloea dura]
MLETTLSMPPGRCLPGLHGAQRVGMPQLALNGLSETWLLADCGDRHWQLLAAASGASIAQLRDGRQRRVYPAFRALRLRHGALDGVREDDVLQIDSTLGRVSRTQFCSKHVISTAGGGLCAVVEMLSVFVARERAGVNTSAVRSPVPGFEHVPQMEEGLGLAAVARKTRGHDADARFGRIGHSYAPVHVQPCPSIHFNGAGFLYFARFPELADQAEWAWFGPRASSSLTTERQLIYHGNANVGTPLVVHLAGFDPDNPLHHHCQIVRGDDKQVIADITTRKRPRHDAQSFLDTLFEPQA